MTIEEVKELIKIDETRIVEMKKTTVSQGVSQNDTKELSERQKVILSLIQKNDTITIEEMIQKTNVSSITIKRDLSELQELNILKREGGRKQGRWVIIEK